MSYRRRKMNMLIKSVRSYTKLSQQELAGKQGVTPVVINQWEEASSVPDKLVQTRLYAFCQEVNIPIYDMMLFEMSSKQGYDSETFASFFMKSDVAKDLDSTYNRMQWAGEEYLLEKTIADSNGKISRVNDPVSSEIMYWIGYIYRYWHFYKNESSSRIHSQAGFKTMK